MKGPIPKWGRPLLTNPTNRKKIMKNKIKLFIWPLLVVIAGIAIFGLAMFAACVPAKADMNSFLQTLANKGYTGPIANWEKMGNQICLAQAQGYDSRTIARAIVAATGTGIYSEEAYEIIAIANQELCINGGTSTVPQTRNRVA